MEVRRYGIRVCTMLPADTDTPMLQAEIDTQPWETREISKGAGLFTAHQVRTVADGLLG